MGKLAMVHMRTHGHSPCCGGMTRESLQPPCLVCWTFTTPLRQLVGICVAGARSAHLSGPSLGRRAAATTPAGVGL